MSNISAAVPLTPIINVFKLAAPDNIDIGGRGLHGKDL
jgi:hypothetical protein